MPCESATIPAPQPDIKSPQMSVDTDTNEAIINWSIDNDGDGEGQAFVTITVDIENNGTVDMTEERQYTIPAGDSVSDQAGFSFDIDEDTETRFCVELTGT